MLCWLQRLTEYQHGRPKTTRVLLLLQVLAEGDEDDFWDHWGRLKTKTVMLKLLVENHLKATGASRG